MVERRKNPRPAHVRGTTQHAGGNTKSLGVPRGKAGSGEQGPPSMERGARNMEAAQSLRRAELGRVGRVGQVGHIRRVSSLGATEPGAPETRTEPPAVSSLVNAGGIPDIGRGPASARSYRRAGCTHSTTLARLLERRFHAEATWGLIYLEGGEPMNSPKKTRQMAPHFGDHR
jgi:hypothetical protein